MNNYSKNKQYTTMFVVIYYTTYMKLSEELAWRGFVNQTTLAAIDELDDQQWTFYFGVDPSAPSMQIGNLAAAMMVRHFVEHGHKAVLLVGGATGLIGDPDGKKQERKLKTQEEIERNKQAIVRQYEQVFAGQSFTLVDNYDWFKDINYLQFLRDVGKHAPMRQLIARDFVRSRLSEDGAGISYAEFSYALIQGYDFLHLHREHGVNLQICGADQWGNSIAGVDLIRRVTGAATHVWSAPLVVNQATGRKFGKSEDGAVWLDGNLTSPFAFYQFWLNVDDGGVDQYLKYYTLLNQQEHADIMAEFQESPKERAAQRTLAYEVTKLVHGQATADAVRSATTALYSSDVIDLSTDEQAVIKQELPLFHAATHEPLELLVVSGVAQSKRQAREFVTSGAIRLNGRQIDSLDELTFVEGLTVVRRGKNTIVLVEAN